MGYNDPPLPVCEDDRSFVLPARTVLWEETGPMLPVVRELHRAAVASLHHVRLPGSYCLHRPNALSDDARIDRIEGDPKSPDTARMRRSTTVAEVDPAEIGTCGAVERRKVVFGAGQLPRLLRPAAITPVPDGGARYPGRACDVARGQPLTKKRQCPLVFALRSNVCIIDNEEDGTPHAPRLCARAWWNWRYTPALGAGARESLRVRVPPPAFARDRKPRVRIPIARQSRADRCDGQTTLTPSARSPSSDRRAARTFRACSPRPGRAARRWRVPPPHRTPLPSP